MKQGDNNLSEMDLINIPNDAMINGITNYEVIENSMRSLKSPNDAKNRTRETRNSSNNENMKSVGDNSDKNLKDKVNNGNSITTTVQSVLDNEPCQVCGFQAKTRVYLQNHIRSKHLGERPHACKFCDYSSFYKSALTQHMRKHTKVSQDEKKYVCSVCEFRTTEKGYLRKHMLYHSKEKKYS